jgi:hypothetical protein
MQAHPDTVLTGTYYRVINEHGWVVRLSPLKITEDIEIRWRLLFGNCLTHSTVMFRKDAAVRAGNYDPRVRAGEDVEFFSRILVQGRLAVIPQVLGAWRVHRKSLSKTESPDYKSDFLATVQSSIRRQLSEPISPALAAALYNQSRAPAENLATFMEGLGFIERAGHQFRQRYARTPRESRLLGRAIFLQLIQMMSRNSHESWWASAQTPWVELTRRLTVNPNGYRWYLDAGLRHSYKALLQSDLSFLFMKRLY